MTMDVLATMFVTNVGMVMSRQLSGRGLWLKSGGMINPVSYKRHRFPPPLIAHAVWLDFRFPLSLRLVEERLLERGIIVSYETIRRWGKRFGPDYARRLRRKRPGPNDVWHLDEG